MTWPDSSRGKRYIRSDVWQVLVVEWWEVLWCDWTWDERGL